MSGPKDSSKANHRVLIVDDNKEFLASFASLIQMSGFEVQTARDGVEGFETAEEFRPSVILMDLGMPRMDGFEAARYIRRQSWGEQILLVAISGWGQAQHRKQSKEAGFDRHLIKPVELNDVLLIIDNYN